MLLTAAQLQAATGCTAERAAQFAPHLTEACNAYSITTPERLAAFLAQIGHESGSLRWTAELWGPTPAQRTYEGRASLGNTQPGDGERFKGRGLIQTTGRYNYAKTRDQLRGRFDSVPDFEAEPSALEQPRWAALSAGSYWDWRRLNALADAGDFDGITQRINGGQNGADDRRARWERAKSALAGAATPIPPSIPSHSPPIAATPPATPEKPMIPALILALGKSLISALTPLAAEKIQREIERHSDKPEVAQQVTAAIVEAAQTATGLADPIEAVAAAKQAPEVLGKVETSALEMLDRMAPVLERLAGIDKADHEATEASRDAAAGRAAGEPWDMTPLLIIGALGMIGLLIVFVGGIAVYQVIQGQIAPEVWAQIAGLIGFVSGVGTTIYAYRFGSSRSSLAKDAVIGELSRRA